MPTKLFSRMPRHNSEVAREMKPLPAPMTLGNMRANSVRTLHTLESLAQTTLTDKNNQDALEHFLICPIRTLAGRGNSDSYILHRTVSPLTRRDARRNVDCRNRTELGAGGPFVETNYGLGDVRLRCSARHRPGRRGQRADSGLHAIFGGTEKGCAALSAATMRLSSAT